MEWIQFHSHPLNPSPHEGGAGTKLPGRGEDQGVRSVARPFGHRVNCTLAFRPKPALTEGTRLGPYEVLAAIGAGGMGEVYRARDTRLDRVVAIKVLAPSMAGDPELRQRFEMELPDGQDFTRGGRHTVALSPDGRRLVYVANTQL